MPDQPNRAGLDAATDVLRDALDYAGTVEVRELAGDIIEAYLTFSNPKIGHVPDGASKGSSSAGGEA